MSESYSESQLLKSPHMLGSISTFQWLYRTCLPVRVLYLDVASPSERFEDAVLYAELILIRRHTSYEIEVVHVFCTMELYSSQPSARQGISRTKNCITLSPCQCLRLVAKNNAQAIRSSGLYGQYPDTARTLAHPKMKMSFLASMLMCIVFWWPKHSSISL